MSAGAETLRDVLAAHDIIKPRGYAWPCCVCGAEFPGGGDDAHVEAAVLAWLAERLADEAVVEEVADVIDRRTGRHMGIEAWTRTADAALAAVRDALGVLVRPAGGEVAPGEAGGEIGPQNGCGVCLTCDPPRRSEVTGLPMMRMYVCATCGNKRCHAASDCRRRECSGSNEPGQVRVPRCFEGGEGGR